jgi:hypothetical protein
VEADGEKERTPWKAEGTNEKAVLSGLESTPPAMSVYEIRFREAMARGRI